MPLSRRGFLAAGAGALATIGAGVAVEAGPRRLREFRNWIERRPDAWIPSAPEGRVRLEQVRSASRGRTVDLFTAVPYGYGDGAGLPVCLVLHGATARPSDFQSFGLGRFLTAAVRRGAPPFVLAGADGGLLWWQPDESGDDDPQRMLLDEMPGWLERRGFDQTRTAAWGWSMGAYGALLLAEAAPGRLRGVAAFSPAVEPGDAVFSSIDRLAGTPVGVWCGRDDPLYPNVRRLVADIPSRPRIVSYAPGAHTRVYWNSVTLPAFAFVARLLTPAAAATSA
ncbi:MAG TPA: alpha/beta hydrolase-fold protein [Gaiellales bacterium]|nr:alpha/beta hydrolase-fold protein [Gaiellales bacterium]